MRFIIDVDGTVCDLVTPWLALWYQLTGERLEHDQVHDYGIHRQLREHRDSGPNFYSLLMTHCDVLYDQAEPYGSAIAVVQALQQLGHETVFASTCFAGTYDAKVEWLERHRLLPCRQRVHAASPLVATTDKSLLHGDVLIDDHIPNVLAWQAAHTGQRVGPGAAAGAFLLERPWNTAYPLLLRRVSWRDLAFWFLGRAV